MIQLAHARTWIIDYAAEMGSRVEELNGLDAALADGDYGTSMSRGLEAAAKTAETSDTDSLGDRYGNGLSHGWQQRSAGGDVLPPPGDVHWRCRRNRRSRLGRRNACRS